MKTSSVASNKTWLPVTKISYVLQNDNLFQCIHDVSDIYTELDDTFKYIDAIFDGLCDKF